MLPPAYPGRGPHFWQPKARLITPKHSYLIDLVGIFEVRLLNKQIL